MTKQERTDLILRHSRNAEIYIYKSGKLDYESKSGLRLSPETIEDIHSAMLQLIIERVDKTDGFGEISMKVAFMRALQVLNLQPKRGSGHLIMMSDHFEDHGRKKTVVQKSGFFQGKRENRVAQAYLPGSL
jgi:hypothetical protein